MEALRKIFYFFNDLAVTIFFAAAIFAVIYVILARPFQVNGQSMYPTYHHGEYVLTNLITLRIAPPARGDVVVFEAPVNPDKDFIKRVIGRPGEKVLIKNGSFFINGKKLDESHYLPVGVKTYGGSFLHEGKEITVPKDHFFVVGDNRDFSSDSREWGFVTQNKIIGKSFVVYWPVSKMAVVQGEKYK